MFEFTPPPFAGANPEEWSGKTIQKIVWRDGYYNCILVRFTDESCVVVEAAALGDSDVDLRCNSVNIREAYLLGYLSKEDYSLYLKELQEEEEVKKKRNDLVERAEYERLKRKFER